LDTTVNANKGVMKKLVTSKITHSLNTTVDRSAEEVDTSKDAHSKIITAMAREELRKYLLPIAFFCFSTRNNREKC
jgi:hypothetical protein